MKTQLRLCKGKDCKKYRKGLCKLAAEVEDLASSETVKCQDICKGAVIVVHAHDHRYWFKKMSGKQNRQNLRTFLMSGQLPKKLEKNMVKRKRI
jgi:hypothetical protein